MTYPIYFDGIIYTLQRRGGISVYFDELISRLHRDNIKHRVGVAKDVCLSVLSSQVVYSRFRLLERYRDVPFLSAKEIFHSTYYRLPENRSIPVVTTVHDFTYERFASGPRRWVHTLQKGRAICRSDAIVCVSNNTKSDLKHFFPNVPERKIHVIPNAASTLFFPIKGARKENEALFVGARSGYKNFKNAVIAMANFPALRLVIVGGGEIQSEERNLLNQFLPNRWRAIGFVENCDLNVLYNSAFFLLYPSIYEGFGIPVVEAMQAGCAVVAVGLSAIPEVSGGACVLAESGSSCDIATAIDSLLNEITYSRTISLGLANAGRFSWENSYQQMLDVYRSI